MRETIKLWVNSLETSVHEVIVEKRHNFKASVTRMLLFVLFTLFRIGVNIRRRPINRSF